MAKQVDESFHGQTAPVELWWARVVVPYLEPSEADQVLVLTPADAQTCLQWLSVMPCTTLDEAIRAAPALKDELIELVEEMEWDEDHFDFAELPGFGDGDLPTPPWSLMQDTLPKELIERFGYVERTTLNGDLAYLRGAEAESIVAWLEERGYTLVEHPEMADLGADPSDFLPK